MKAPISRRLKLASRKLSVVHVARQLRAGRVLMRLADDLGLVYFGTRDSKRSEHRLVNGITSSTTYFDRHLTVGTYKGYNISFVVRRDLLVKGKRDVDDTSWTVLTVELHTAVREAPLYILSRDNVQLLQAKFAPLYRIELPGSEQFRTGYLLYGRQALQEDISQLLTDQLQVALAHHLSGLSVEVTGNTLYLYDKNRYPTRQSLTRQLSVAIWLAEIFDGRVES